MRTPECLLDITRAGIGADVEQSGGIFPEKAIDDDVSTRHKGEQRHSSGSYCNH